VAASFKIEVTSIFGNNSQNREATKDSHELPGVGRFKDWDTGNGYTGARYVLLNANEDSRSMMINSASSNLTGEAFLVATTMISQSSNFWVTLSTWVSQTYRDLVGRGGQPADTWRLNCQSLCKIFHELYVAREAGRGRIDSSDKPAAIVWGCLQGFRRMKTFLDNNIGQDPVLFHILNKHLVGSTTEGYKYGRPLPVFRTMDRPMKGRPSKPSSLYTRGGIQRPPRVSK